MDRPAAANLHPSHHPSTAVAQLPSPPTSPVAGCISHILSPSTTQYHHGSMLIFLCNVPFLYEGSGVSGNGFWCLPHSALALSRPVRMLPLSAAMHLKLYPCMSLSSTCDCSVSCFEYRWHLEWRLQQTSPVLKPHHHHQIHRQSFPCSL